MSDPKVERSAAEWRLHLKELARAQREAHFRLELALTDAGLASRQTLDQIDLLAETLKQAEQPEPDHFSVRLPSTIRDSVAVYVDGRLWSSMTSPARPLPPRALPSGTWPSVPEAEAIVRQMLRSLADFALRDGAGLDRAAIAKMFGRLDELEAKLEDKASIAKT